MKEKDPITEGDQKIEGKHCNNRNYTYNQIQKKYIQELISLDCAVDDFLWVKLVFLCFLIIWIYYNCYPTH